MILSPPLSAWIEAGQAIRSGLIARRMYVLPFPLFIYVHNTHAHEREREKTETVTNQKHLIMCRIQPTVCKQSSI